MRKFPNSPNSPTVRQRRHALIALGFGNGLLSLRTLIPGSRSPISIRYRGLRAVCIDRNVCTLNGFREVHRKQQVLRAINAKHGDQTAGELWLWSGSCFAERKNCDGEGCGENGRGPDWAVKEVLEVAVGVLETITIRWSITVDFFWE